MRQFNKWLLPFVCAAMVFTACKQDFDLTPVLDVTKNELNCTKDATTEEIGVTVNEGDEIYLVVSASAREWLSVTVNEDKTAITIEVAENVTKADRSGEITVMIHKGSLSERITVNQSGFLSVILSQDNVRANALPQTGIEIRVEGNYTGELSVSTTLEWIDITSKDSGKFVFDIGENTSTASRSGEIVISVDGVDIKLPVWQDGVFTFQIPYLKFGYDYTQNKLMDYYNLSEAIDFEIKRGNTYIQSAMNAVHVFSTISSVIPQIVYATNQSQFYIHGAYYESITEDLSQNEDYLNYMQSEGFELIYNESNYLAMWSEELMMQMFYNIGQQRIGFHHSRYKPHHHSGEQMFDLETFDAIPWPYLGFGETLAKVKSWEAERGSSALDEGPDVWTFTPNSDTDSILERAYFIKEGKLTAVMVLFENLEMGMFPYFNIDSPPFNVTKEMQALLESEGFELRTAAYNMAGFVNEARNLLFEVRVQGFESEDSLPRLVFYIKPYVS